MFAISYSVTFLFMPQHFLYFLPLPQGHGSLRPILLDFVILIILAFDVLEFSSCNNSLGV